MSSFFIISELMKYLFMFLFIGLLSCGDSPEMDFLEVEDLAVYDSDLVTITSDGMAYTKHDMIPITGVVLERGYNNQTVYRKSFKNGKPHGLFEKWHDNGQLRLRANFKENKSDGLWREWDWNGELAVEINYKEGEIISEK